MSANEKDLSDRIHHDAPLYRQSLFSPASLSSPITMSLTWKGGTHFPTGLLKKIELLINDKVQFSASVFDAMEGDPIKLSLINSMTKQASNVFRINHADTLKALAIKGVTGKHTMLVPLQLDDLQPGAHYHLELRHVVRRCHDDNGSSYSSHEIHHHLVRYVPTVEQKDELAKRLFLLFEPELGRVIDSLALKIEGQSITVDRKQYYLEFMDSIDALNFEKLHNSTSASQLVCNFCLGKEAFLTPLIAGILTTMCPLTEPGYILKNASNTAGMIYPIMLENQQSDSSLRP